MIYLVTKIKKYIRKLLQKLGYRLYRVGPYGIFDFESFLYRHIEVHNSLSFIQIGANDGVMNDPIYSFNQHNRSVVKGYVLEPLPDIFDQLVLNYKYCPTIKPFNLAIHETQSEMVLHRINPKYQNMVPEFSRGIASFDEMHWKKTTLIASQDYLEKITVKCISFTEFVKLNKIKDLDLLLIDTEGYDYEILMSINFNEIKPKIIRFEHGVRDNLMSPEKFMTVCNYLNTFGYQIIAESYDATAYLLDPADLVF